MSVDDLTPEQVTPSRSTKAPSKKALAAVLAAAAMVGLGAGGWFALLSPHDSTVTVAADASAAVPGKALPLTGTVTPSRPNRVVTLGVATSPGGPYTNAGTAITDVAGRFQTAWTPTQAGKVWIQATAVELGRDQQAQAMSAPVIVRTPATLTLTLSATAIRTTAALTVTATVAPVGGTVTLEKSADGQTWTAVPVTPGKNGTATAKLAGLAGGTWHIRGRATQTDTAGAATSQETPLLVEDYKAAAAKYLAIVATGNAAVDKLNSLIDSGASLSSVKRQAAILSRAYTQQAKDFRGYKTWPREVAPVIADLAKACVLDADDFHMRSQVRTIDEWNAQADRGNASADAGSAAAARARDLLGLPKRNLHP